MLCERGDLYDVVKVLEYGLVNDTQQAPKLPQAKPLVSTPLYMAPELITNASNYSPSSDLYALGGVGYYLLTGCHVFEGGSLEEICAMHLHDSPVPPSQRTEREIPADLEALLLACLAKQAEERPESAEAMAEALAQCEAFAVWTSEQARQWWLENRSALPTEEQGEDEPASHENHIPVDMGDQAGRQRATS